MLRKLLMSTVVLVGATGVAFAADLPSRKSAPVYVPPPPVFTWTGVYVGGQIGYQWGYSGTSSTPGGAGFYPAYNPNGVTGGAHIGYNYQFSPNFVAGLEGDVNGLSYNGSNSAFGLTYGTRELVDGSVRGRIGVAWDRALFYATGGAAFGDFRNTYNFGPFSDAQNVTRVGWTVGGGVEYAIDNNWSVRAEYRYTDFGHFSEFSPSLGSTVFKRESDNKVQVGFSYKFDLMNAPILAKY
ncbi:MAG: outer membrane protein [Methylovirgula sp.]